MNRRGLEFGVGLFLLIGLACLAYLSFSLGKVSFWGSPYYKVHATYSTVSGLKERAPVDMAGVEIGQVHRIQLKDGQALVTLDILKKVRLEVDVIASIKTMGLLGEKYVSISPGAADQYIKPGGFIMDTQPPLDIESLIARFVFGSIQKKGP